MKAGMVSSLTGQRGHTQKYLRMEKKRGDSEYKDKSP